MTQFIRVMGLLAAVAALAACSTSRETWIGRNVGVAVDSRADGAATAGR
jgi:hypothetical protein